MADLLEEVKEGLWQERLTAFLQRYWRHLIGSFILLVIIFALVQWNMGRVKELKERSGALYQKAVSALDMGDVQVAEGEMEALAATGVDGYHALARLQLAALYQKTGRLDKALEAYLALEDSHSDVLFRDMAALQAGKIHIQREDFLAALEILEPASTKGRPWRYSALELMALAERLLGHNEKAIAYLTEIKDGGDAPPTLYQRSLAGLVALGVTPQVEAKDTDE